MNRYYYDLHIHSCLSPCGDTDSTPNNIIGMGVLNGLNIMALTDHNTCKNCPSFFTAAKKNGIIPVAGMELTTAEEIHVVFLFRTLEDALSFNEEIDLKRIKIKNRPDIFGEQLITDSQDNIIGKEEDLLSNATAVTLEECLLLAKKYGAVCYPAHIDRESNGVIAVLGTYPKDLPFTCLEFKNKDNIASYMESYGLKGYSVIVNSDAHQIWNISEKENYFDLEDEPYSGDFVREQLFKKLEGNE